MAIRPIRSHDDHAAALRRIDELWGADPGTPEGDELDVLFDLVEHYEAKHWPTPDAEPHELLQAHVEEREDAREDLARLLGSAALAEEVLAGRQTIPDEAVERIAAAWRIEPEALARAPGRRSNAA